MAKHNVWSIVLRDRLMQIVSVKWIFSIKAYEQKKARLVAFGCHDIEKHSPIDEALPTPSSDATQWLLAHCLYMKIHLRQLDIKTAFLQAPLHHEKYISSSPERA